MPDSTAFHETRKAIQMKPESTRTNTAVSPEFHLILVKPTHYDDDGYPIQWLRYIIPSNSLACLYGRRPIAVTGLFLGLGTAKNTARSAQI